MNHTSRSIMWQMITWPSSKLFEITDKSETKLKENLSTISLDFATLDFTIVFAIQWVISIQGVRNKYAHRGAGCDLLFDKYSKEVFAKMNYIMPPWRTKDRICREQIVHTEILHIISRSITWQMKGVRSEAGMHVSGLVRGIRSVYEKEGENSGPLRKMTFEEPSTHLRMMFKVQPYQYMGSGVSKRAATETRTNGEKGRCITKDLLNLGCDTKSRLTAKTCSRAACWAPILPAVAIFTSCLLLVSRSGSAPKLFTWYHVP